MAPGQRDHGDRRIILSNHSNCWETHLASFQCSCHLSDSKGIYLVLAKSLEAREEENSAFLRLSFRHTESPSMCIVQFWFPGLEGLTL